MSQPDLFVVCKNCGSEVSPYVTECPYCGQRVRKRAPKIDRDRDPEQPRPVQRKPRLPRLRADEIAGIAPDRRPYATMALIALSLVATLLVATNEIVVDEIGGLVVPGREEAWRWFLSPFIHGDKLGYQFVALVAVGVFGSLLERRFGPVPVVLTFLAAGVAGSALATVAEVPPLLADQPIFLVLGANGAALGMLAAWFVDDRRAARRGEDRETDLLGVGVFAAVLVLLSLAVEEANIAAAVAGAAAGAVIGLVLPLFTRR